ncbi:tetratricopeptide repeat protein [Leptospira sp. WS4.C2]
MILRSRRIWQFGVLVTSLFLVSKPNLAQTGVLNPVKSLYGYEDLLRMAEDKIIQETPAKAFDFLIKAKEINPDPDFRYYNLSARAHMKLGQIFEGIHAYEESVKKKNDQLDLVLYIADFYEKERKAKEALFYTKLYLEQKPNAKYRLYTAGILARQLGLESEYETYFQKLESDKTFVSEKEALQTSLQKNIKNKKWKEADDLSLRYLVYFPREEGMYETLILARRGRQSDLLEQAYQWTTTVFLNETRYFTRYGVYLQEKQRYLESLSLFRRGFYNLLKFYPESDAGEILFLIRQSYANLGKDRDTLAIDSLVKDFKNQNQLTGVELENHQFTYRKNREYLLFCIHWFSKRNITKANEFRQKLKDRDVEFEESEFLRVIGPFASLPQDL